MVSLAATGIEAQTRLDMEAGLSHARPPADVEADPATYSLLGGRFIHGPVFGSLFGALALDSHSADWLGGSLGASWQTGGVGVPGFALTGLVTAFTLGDPTPYDAIAGRLVPEARLTLGSQTLVARGAAGIGHSDVVDRSVEPPVSVVSDLWMYGAGLELVTPLSPLGTVQAWAGGEAYNSAAGGYFAASVGASGTLGRGSWDLLTRLWDTPTGTELELGLTLTFGLGPGWRLEGTAGRAAPDPLLGSPAAVDGGLRVIWNPLAGAPSPPLVSALIEGDATVVLFQLVQDDAETVSVIGDFSGWKPVAMERQGELWVARVPLQPGLYHFGFLVDGEWHVPGQAPGRVTDEFGRVNATLVVPDR